MLSSTGKRGQQSSDYPDSLSQPPKNDAETNPHCHHGTKKAAGSIDGANAPLISRRQSAERHRDGNHRPGETSLGSQMHLHGGIKRGSLPNTGPKVGSMPRPVGGNEKLGTFSGVFVPTSLNVLSILMFLRFGFILGQSGVIGMMGMLIASYIINLVTTLSISAIATNGTVRGGGAYYLISRSLGPEFGGSIGVVFYLGSVFNTGMNAVGLVDCLKANFGEKSGNWAHWLPQGPWVEYVWATIILIVCTAICLAGSGIFARCSNGLLAILLIATFSIPFSALVMEPSNDRGLGIEYTGIRSKTFMGNLFPKFTQGADGSQLSGKENYQDLFGVLFPATGGIFAGASMSGDLKHPSKAIPKGTLGGIALTFIAYTIVIFAMAATITRESFYHNANVIQDTNISGVLILLGEFATGFFSSLMGVIGSAKLLQALARDNLLPGFHVFGQGTKGHDEPTYAIIITHIVAQLTMFFDINQIASFITMTYLMTFLVTDLACFFLTISSAPNFRPSFHYFNWWTAGFGALISGVSMFFVDGLYASGCVGILIVIFLIIHYTSPPKSWGDVSQSLIYHQVRKYLLRLKQEHVKFWRPQILLFVNNPRHQYELIQFCNSLKKGALFVLGHVIVSNNFGDAVPEARRQQAAWTKFIDFSKIKAFVNIAISPGVEWGTRNIVLSAGLGGMRPNIVVLGGYNLKEFRKDQPLIDLPSAQGLESRSDRDSDTPPNQKYQPRELETRRTRGLLPTDSCKSEGAVSIKSYVTILEDLLLRLQINVAIAKGFKDLKFPQLDGERTKKYIDLWPIQMSAEISAEGEQQSHNVLTTNFDTYTLILQLGCILNTVPAWKKSYTLRVAVFVEYESDVEEERGRVKTLLDNLRIQAEILVFWLASGDVKSYEVVVNGNLSSPGEDAEKLVDKVLKEEEWWQDIQKLRGKGSLSAIEELAEVQGLLSTTPTWPNTSFQDGRRDSPVKRFQGIKRIIRKSKRRRSFSGFGAMGLKLGMRTHRLNDDVVNRHASHASASEDSSSNDEDSDSTESDLYQNLISGKASPASENDIDDFEEEPDSGVIHNNQPTKLTRRRSHGDSMKAPSAIKPSNSKQDTLNATNIKGDPASLTQPGPEPHVGETVRKLARPLPSRAPSSAKFSSRPVPKTKVATEDGPGPSIMFSDASPAQDSPRHPSIYFHGAPSLPATPAATVVTAAAAAAGGYPFPQSIPLSFNDLPCRAQHLILNELMQQHSADTAVLFTTLPSPVEGTCTREDDCVRYLSDLEVLCADLPPVLLVHSNSMTVTMNL